MALQDAVLPSYLALFIGLFRGERGHLWVGVPHPNLPVPSVVQPLCPGVWMRTGPLKLFYRGETKPLGWLYPPPDLTMLLGSPLLGCHFSPEEHPELGGTWVVLRHCPSLGYSFLLGSGKTGLSRRKGRGLRMQTGRLEDECSGHRPDWSRVL